MNELQKLKEQLAEYKKAEAKHKRFQKIIMDTDRRLQESTQKLYDAKRDLEKKNKALKEAKEREKHQRELAENELKALKHIKDTEPATDKKLTKDAAADLSLRYINLLRCYLKTKDLDKQGPLVEEFCRKLLDYGITPRGIIDIHLKSVPQINTMGELETQRITFEARMVLLTVMTKYASLLRDKL